MSLSPISLIAAVSGADPTALTAPGRTARTQSFSSMIFDGIDNINHKMIEADKLTAAFVLDDSIPPHQVLFALDEARGSFEMLMQVRSRLVEGYQEIMRMQL